MSKNSELDLVLWGATGFTGRLVAEYLAGTYEPATLSWAIAGRNPDKLRPLRERVLENHEGWSELPIRTADAFNPDELDDLASGTKVICSTVGPYAKYGTDLVEACVNNRTDYCDLTGEVQWMRRMIDRFHEPAQSAGVRIVHSCGFDAVPSDIGTLIVQQRARDEFGVSCDRVHTFVTSGSTHISGGTASSILQTFEDVSANPELQEVVDDPYSLAPRKERTGPDTGEQAGPRYDKLIDQWTAPFVMAMVNERVVRRSNALLDHAYGRDFRYRESIPAGAGVLGLARATGISAGLWVLYGALSVWPLRTLLRKFVFPDSGEGPTDEEMKSGSFRMNLVGRGIDPENDQSFEVRCEIFAPRDPGYGATAWMLGESAVALAKNETKTELNGGILTPATGIGRTLPDRLEKTGLTFTLDARTIPDH